MSDIRTVYADMPATVKAYTIFYDGFYTIVLNQNLSRAQNMKSYLHEIEHVKRGDYDSDKTADQIEFFSRH